MTHLPIDNSPIRLPSFLRRITKSTALKQLIREQGCELSRIGRSRNWQLVASFEQLEALISIIESSTENSWQWLAVHLKKQRKNLSFDMLIKIASKTPSITVTELMSRTDCTIADARRVIDTIEFD